MRQIIEMQPTAYDVDKVTNILKEKADARLGTSESPFDIYAAMATSYYDSADIVRSGEDEQNKSKHIQKS